MPTNDEGSREVVHQGLRANPVVAELELWVGVLNAVVPLTGRALSRNRRRRAEAPAAGLPGVRGVANRIHTPGAPAPSRAINIPQREESVPLRRLAAVLLALGWVLLAGCRPVVPVCPPPSGTPEYLAAPPPTAAPPSASTPVTLAIGGRSVGVDQVVSGPLCNGDWRGTVYVTCDVQVLPWQGEPTFLQGCDLTIAPDTVVYVAAHNDTPYYNGCSCHSGAVVEP